MIKRIKSEPQHNKQCMLEKMSRGVWQVLFSHLDDVKAVAYLSMTSKTIKTVMKKLGDKIVWKRSVLKVYDDNEGALYRRMNAASVYLFENVFEYLAKQVLVGGCIGCTKTGLFPDLRKIAKWKGVKICCSCQFTKSRVIPFDWVYFFPFKSDRFHTNLKKRLRKSKIYFLSDKFIETIVYEDWIKMCRRLPHTHNYVVKMYLVKKLEKIHAKFKTLLKKK